MTHKVNTPPLASPKKAAAKKAKKPISKPNHPRTSEMVNGAIATLKERGGSSLQAIKKYIAGTHMVDVEKLAPFIKKYIKAAVANGTLTQTKGKGASGSFKLASSKTVAKPKSKTAAKPKVAAPKAKKPAAEKKAVAEKKKTPKMVAKPPKAKSTTAKSKVTKASPKKAKAAPKAKPAAKKVAKK